jgi:hypothetical protein
MKKCPKYIKLDPKYKDYVYIGPGKKYGISGLCDGNIRSLAINKNGLVESESFYFGNEPSFHYFVPPYHPILKTLNGPKESIESLKKENANLIKEIERLKNIITQVKSAVN